MKPKNAKRYSERQIRNMLTGMLNRASCKPANAGLISEIENAEDTGIKFNETAFVLTMGNGESFEITVTKQA